MAIIKKLLLKNELGQDVPYDIGADGSNVAYDENNSVNEKISTVSTTVGTQGTDITNHKATNVVSQAGAHGLRYYNGALQANVNNTQERVTTGGNIAAIPICIDEYFYNGSSQTPNFIGYDSNKMTASGLSAKTYSGTYEVTFSLKEGFVQEDGTTSSKTMKQTIQNEPANYYNQTVSSGEIIDLGAEEKTHTLCQRIYSKADSYTLTLNTGGATATNGFMPFALSEGITIEQLSSKKQQIQISKKGINSFMLPFSYNENYYFYVYSDVTSNNVLVPQTTGSDEDIMSMINGYYDGQLDLDEIKSCQAVGDIRQAYPGDHEKFMIKSHSGNTNICNTATIPEQTTVKQMILDFNHDKLKTAVGSRTNSLVTIQMLGMISDGSAPSSTSYLPDMQYMMKMNSSSTNVGGQPSTDIRTYLNNNFYNALGFKSIVKTVLKDSFITDSDTSATQSEDNVFLPSESETYGQYSGSSYYKSRGNEGSKYNYYNSIMPIKYAGQGAEGPDYAWQLRSAYKGSSTSFIYASGSSPTGAYGSRYGISPCICL